MGSLIDKIPEILEKSGNLFGIFALVAIILAIIVFFLFRNAGTKQKERVFIYLTLFLLALVFSSLTVGIFSGFETGSEAVTAQVEEDPSWVKLSSVTVEKLEEYIASSGETVTEESKTRILSIAVDNYLEPSEEVTSETASSSPTATPSQSDSTNAKSRELMVADILFNLRGCSRTLERIKCSFLMTNEERDETIYLYAEYGGIISRVITPQGSQLVANKVELGRAESTSYIYNIALAQDVGLAAEISFEGVPQQVNQLALLELAVKSKSSGHFTVRFRNVPISN